MSGTAASSGEGTAALLRGRRVVPTLRDVWQDNAPDLAGRLIIAVWYGAVGLTILSNAAFIGRVIAAAAQLDAGTAPRFAGWPSVLWHPAAVRFEAGWACSLAASVATALLAARGRQRCREQDRLPRLDAESASILWGLAGTAAAVTVAELIAGFDAADPVRSALPLVAGVEAAALPLWDWGRNLAEEAHWPRRCVALFWAVYRALPVVYEGSPMDSVSPAEWAELWATGLHPDTVAELLDSGHTAEQIIESQRAEVPAPLTGGWL